MPPAVAVFLLGECVGGGGGVVKDEYVYQKIRKRGVMIGKLPNNKEGGFVGIFH